MADTERYIVFDTETPNSCNDRMSAIGITVVEDGVITEEISTLVDPETWFDPFNIRLTGIRPEMAARSAAFPELWREIEPVMSSGLLIAHNAAFDMRVLAKCLRDYGIQWRDLADYACTCQMGRRCYPDLPDHKLNTLCDYVGISLDHHQAASDSHACAELLLDYMYQGLDVGLYRRTYDLRAIRTLSGGNRRSRIV